MKANFDVLMTQKARIIELNRKFKQAEKELREASEKLTLALKEAEQSIKEAQQGGISNV